MSIFEYDEEKELALIRRDEYDAGVEAGKREGKAEGIEGIVTRMLSIGTYSLEEISHVSGLSVEALREIITKQKIKIPY